MKLTAPVDVWAEDGVWKAESETLGIYAEGETPDKAVEALGSNLQNRENQIAKDKAAKPHKNDPKPPVSELTLVAIKSAKLTELQRMADVEGIPTTGVKKADLQELLLNALDEKGDGEERTEEEKEDGVEG